MRLIKKHFEEIGIILSYIAMLVATYIFDWKPYAIFISYLVEVIVILLIYVVLRFIDERKNPRRYRKSQPIVNILIGIIPLILFQFFTVGIMASVLNPDENILKHNFILTKKILFAFASFAFIFILKALQMIKNKEILIVFQNNFLFKVITLSPTY